MIRAVRKNDTFDPSFDEIICQTPMENNEILVTPCGFSNARYRVNHQEFDYFYNDITRELVPLSKIFNG